MFSNKASVGFKIGADLANTSRTSAWRSVAMERTTDRGVPLSEMSCEAISARSIGNVSLLNDSSNAELLNAAFALRNAMSAS